METNLKYKRQKTGSTKTINCFSLMTMKGCQRIIWSKHIKASELFSFHGWGELSDTGVLVMLSKELEVCRVGRNWWSTGIFPGPTKSSNYIWRHIFLTNVCISKYTLMSNHVSWFLVWFQKHGWNICGKTENPQSTFIMSDSQILPSMSMYTIA